MIDLNLQMLNVEKLMQLMEQYGIEELSVDFVHLVRNKKSVKVKVDNDVDDLDKHMQPLSNEPWLSLSDEDIEPYVRTGRT